MTETRNSTLRHSDTVSGEYTRSYTPSVPDHYGDPLAEYSALKNGAALVERDQNILRLVGKDPTGMLTAILTNDVPKEEQRGVYAALLDPKGRVQSDLRCLRIDEEILILTEPEGSEAARTILGRYAPFSRVTVEDLIEHEIPWRVLGIYGPRATKLIGGREIEEHETRSLEIGGISVLATGVRLPVPGYDLIGLADKLSEVRRHLTEAGALPAGAHAYETVRVESETPRFGSDMSPENFPGEAGILDRAVSFSKGCYPGQETVARMHYRGHPNRALHRFVVEGKPPKPDTPIRQNDKQVGRITSVAPLPVNDQILALGYLHRNADTEIPLKAGEAAVSLAQEAGI